LQTTECYDLLDNRVQVKMKNGRLKKLIRISGTMRPYTKNLRWLVSPPMIYNRQYCTTVEDKVLCYIEREGRTSLSAHPHALKTGLAGPLGNTFQRLCSRCTRLQDSISVGVRYVATASSRAYRAGAGCVQVAGTPKRCVPPQGRRSEIQGHEKQLLAAMDPKRWHAQSSSHTAPHSLIDPTFILYQTGLLATPV